MLGSLTSYTDLLSSCELQGGANSKKNENPVFWELHSNNDPGISFVSTVLLLDIYLFYIISANHTFHSKQLILMLFVDANVTC